MTAPTKPTKLPRWADTVEDSTRKVLEPNEGHKDVGYGPGQPLDAQRLNWLFNKGYRALEWLFSLFGEESPGGRMTLTRDVTATGALKVQGLTETAGGLSTTGNIAATGNLSATGNATVGGTLGVAGNVTLGTDAMNTHVVNGVTDFKGAVTHSNNTNFAAGKTHTFSGPISAAAISASSVASTGGLTVTTGTTNGDALTATGNGTGVGAIVEPGTHSTTSVPRNALAVNYGNILFLNPVNPSSNVAFTNTVTPMNVCKAWARITTNGSGGASVQAGFNISSVTATSGGLTITFATPFANVNYTILITKEGVATNQFPFVAGGTATTTTVAVGLHNNSGGAIDLTGTAVALHVVVFGAQ